MSRNEDVTTAIWADPDFEALAPNAKLLYLWSFTNEHNNMAGLYKIGRRTMTFETGLDSGALDTALAELTAGKFLSHVEDVLFVRARVKRLRSKTPQIARSIAKDVEKLPVEHPQRQAFLRAYATEEWLRLDNPEKCSFATPQPVNTEPLIEVPLSGQGSSSVKREVYLPDGFPRELRPHLRAVFRVLRSLAGRHGAKAVSPLSLAQVVMARPRKPLVRAAFDCAAHWDGRSQQLKDVVAAYRNWLDRCDDLAGVEPVDAEGLPAAGVRAGRQSASQMLRDMGFSAEGEPVDAEVVDDEAGVAA